MALSGTEHVKLPGGCGGDCFEFEQYWSGLRCLSMRHIRNESQRLDSS